MGFGEKKVLLWGLEDYVFSPPPPGQLFLPEESCFFKKGGGAFLHFFFPFVFFRKKKLFFFLVATPPPLAGFKMPPQTFKKFFSFLFGKPFLFIFVELGAKEKSLVFTFSFLAGERRFLFSPGK